MPDKNSNNPPQAEPSKPQPEKPVAPSTPIPPKPVGPENVVFKGDQILPNAKNLIRGKLDEK